jgi:hypothetical protein
MLSKNQKSSILKSKSSKKIKNSMIKVRRIKRFLVMINYRKLLSVIKFLKLIKNKKINNVLEKYQKIKILKH